MKHPQRRGIQPGTTPDRGFLKRRPVRILFFALVHYLVLLLVAGLLFFASHIPPKAVNLDRLILGLFRVETILSAPRKALLSLWPGESTPGLLSLMSTVFNSLLWGCLVAGLASLWAKARSAAR